MTTAADAVRTVRIEVELRFRTTPGRLFRALSEEIAARFPYSQGGRTRAVVIEPAGGTTRTGAPALATSTGMSRCSIRRGAWACADA